MTQEQRAQFWLVLGDLLAARYGLRGSEVQPYYDAVNAELDKYTIITEPVAVPEGIAAVVRVAVECREDDGFADDGYTELCEAVDKLSPTDLAACLAACGVKGGVDG